MAVREVTAPGEGQKRQKRDKAPRDIPMGPLGVVAMIVGAVLWLIGARYTLAGWVDGLNIAIAVVGLPARIPAPSGWWWLLAIPLGLLYSLAEVRIVISMPASAGQVPAWLVAVVVLALIHTTDVGSTALGYLTVGPDAWAIHRWAASDGWIALGVWSIVLTYFPERAILWGSKWARGGWW